MNFIWDENKNAINKQKHGVSFETAAYVFRDPMKIQLYDETHSIYEDRWQIIGCVSGAVLFVVETEITEDLIRIISARPATSAERSAYYGQIN